MVIRKFEVIIDNQKSETVHHFSGEHNVEGIRLVSYDTTQTVLDSFEFSHPLDSFKRFQRVRTALVQFQPEVFSHDITGCITTTYEGRDGVNSVLLDSGKFSLKFFERKSNKQNRKIEIKGRV